MSKLRNYQSQFQSAIENGIKSVERQHQSVAGRSFDYALKVEEEAKSYSLKGLRDRHDRLVGSLYGQALDANRRINDFAADLIRRIEGEVHEARDSVVEAEEAVEKKVRKTANKARATTRRSTRKVAQKVEENAGKVEESLS